ncbi:hypothetical protein FACS1894205_1530 [Alphaproteobacteria bacterium]|nr:hypothetical protein FACS1894205_1530 [Alphaproteobacteria bacterium]
MIPRAAAAASGRLQTGTERKTVWALAEERHQRTREPQRREKARRRTGKGKGKAREQQRTPPSAWEAEPRSKPERAVWLAFLHG